MRVIDCEQGSAEWLQVRVGRITASRMGDVTAKLQRGGVAQVRWNYRMELVAERLTGRSADHFVSLEMKWGSEQEQFGRTAYELQTETMTDRVGFILHPSLDYSGASPDSLVSTDGGLEMKCPKTTTHLAYRMAGVVPEEYQPQMLWNMACAERAWWDFCSYDPRLPENLRLFTVRLPRDDDRIAQIEGDVRRLDGEIEAAMDSLGAPRWAPVTQISHAELNAKMGKIGDLDVPEDLIAMLSREIVP